MARLDDDAVLLSNDSLRRGVLEHRREQLEFLLEAQRLVREQPLYSRCAHGIVNSRNSLGVGPESERRVGALIAEFERCLPEYTLFEFELWFGGEAPTPPHNDAVFYLTTGQTVALQFWLLLEACTIGGSGEPVDAPRGKNALECLLPVAPGVMFPGMTHVLTRDGQVEHRAERVVGGDEMAIGDLLLFKNGVIHTAPGSRDTFRAALAFRAHLSAEDYAGDVDTLLWFRDELRRNPELEERLIHSGNPYFHRVVRQLKATPGEGPDLSRVRKVDRHDHAALRARLAEHDFAGAIRR